MSKDFPQLIRRASAIIIEETDVSAYFKHHIHIRLEELSFDV
jgi:hypothetical protein